jgi:hypothetical protein
MGDMGEAWADYRQAQQERRHARLPVRTAEIAGLEEHGFIVVQLTEYQFRVNGQIDLYPIHRRYHVLSTGKRGTYSSALRCVRQTIGGGR